MTMLTTMMMILRWQWGKVILQTVTSAVMWYLRAPPASRVSVLHSVVTFSLSNFDILYEVLS